MADKLEGFELELTDVTARDYEKLVEMGHGEEDISTLFRLKKA
jgi:3-hydroxyisobutyrate dehydrogenase